MMARQTSTSRTIQAYETYQDIYLRHWNRRSYEVPPHLNGWTMHLRKDALLLDLGCGPGQDSRYLRRQGYRVCGLDLTWSFLQVAKGRAPRLPIVQADIRFLPFAGQAFDGIWAAASLIHLPKTMIPRVLKCLFRLTKPGGWLAVTVMHGYGGGGVSPNQWIPGRYLTKWLKQELDRVVRAAKWEVVSLKRVNGQERKGAWLNLLARRPR